ncbi:MAG: hypothetical protein QOF89_1395 [Acidobacteriota bacterium]|nr:hypothetical protein [Acidobacteriota bacterium]
MDLLPGLWLGLLGGFLAAALRRWYDPVPGRVLAVFAAALLILFAPVLFGGRVLLPVDSLRAHVFLQDRPQGDPREDLILLAAPSQAAVREALHQGRWPLWNRRAGAGMPLLADPEAEAFQPLTLLGLPLTLPRAAGFVAALRVLVALVFGFLWLRRLGLGSGLALAGALVWGLGGFLVLGVGGTLANPVALLPFAFYAAVRSVVCPNDPDGRRDAFLLALAVLCLLLDGHPETIVCALGLALLVFLDRLRRQPAGLRRVILLRAGTAVLAAAAVAAPLLLPTLHYLPQTVRGWRHFKVRRGASGFTSASSRRLALPRTESLSAVQYGLHVNALRGYRMAALGNDFPPNLATLYGLEDARIYGPTAPKAYVDFLAPIVVGGPADPLYRQLGVRYLLTRLDARLPAPWKRIFADRTAAVWEQSESLPLLFLATDRPVESVLPRRIEDTWISGLISSPISDPISPHPPLWLGTRVFQDGGWVVLLNGVPRAAVPRLFVTAPLSPGPPGERRFDLLYRPAEFVWGWVIAALGLAMGAAAWVPPPVRSTAPAAPPPPATPG